MMKIEVHSRAGKIISRFMREALQAVKRKLWPLGIPPVRDRGAQEVLLRLLATVYKPQFYGNSYWFKVADGYILRLVEQFPTAGMNQQVQEAMRLVQRDQSVPKFKAKAREITERHQPRPDDDRSTEPGDWGWRIIFAAAWDCCPWKSFVRTEINMVKHAA